MPEIAKKTCKVVAIVAISCAVLSVLVYAVFAPCIALFDVNEYVVCAVLGGVYCSAAGLFENKLTAKFKISKIMYFFAVFLIPALVLNGLRLMLTNKNSLDLFDKARGEMSLFLIIAGLISATALIIAFLAKVFIFVKNRENC